MAADSTLERFVSEVVAGEVVLDSLDEAAAAEAWASGAVAEWLALGGGWGELSTRVPLASAPLTVGIIAYVEGSPMPTGLSEWASDVGKHEVVEAVRVSGGNNEIAIIVGYEAPSGARHDASVSIEHGKIVDLSLGPPGLAAAASEHDAGSLSTTAMSTTDAESALRLALENVDPELLGESARLNLPIMLRRFSLQRLGSTARTRSVPIPERNVEDDRYSAELVRSSLRIDVDAIVPEVVGHARTEFLSLLERGEPDAATLLDVAGIDVDLESAELSDENFLRVVGAYVSPSNLSAHEMQSQQAIVRLESADWVGAILGAVRSGAGTIIDGEALVGLINRCPEVATTIPRREAPQVAWAFDQMLYAWATTGVVDDDGALTAAGEWLLPRSTIASWTRVS